MIGFILRREAVDLHTDFFRFSWVLFVRWKTFNVLPHGKGTLDERNTTLEILRILNEEEHLFDSWEQEKRQKSMDGGRRPRRWRR